MPRRSDSIGNFVWTEKTLAKALAWWVDDGRSYRWIAAALGATPGQVSGMASRRRWPTRPRATPTALPIRRVAAQAAPAAPRPLRPAPAAVPAPVQIAGLIAPPAAAPIAPNVSGWPLPMTAIGLLGWRAGLCRYPVNNPPPGEMEHLLYCGRDIDPAGLEAGHVYCPTHHVAAHQHAKPSAARELTRMAQFEKAAACCPPPPPEFRPC